MAENNVKPEVPELVIRPVANGYIVMTGAPLRGDYGSMFDNEKTYVTGSFAGLCRILKHVSVKAKLNP